MELSNPLLLAALSICTFVLVLGFTTPTSPIRPLGLLTIATYVFIIFISPSHREWFTHPIYPNLTGGMTFSMFLQYLDIAILQGWSYDAQGPTRTVEGTTPRTWKNRKPRSGSFYDRFKFGLDLVFNKRLVDTPWEAHNVLPFDRKNPQRVPSKAEFLVKNSLRCFICVALLDAIGLAGKDTSQNHILFAQNSVPFFTRLSNITGAEIGVRVSSSIATALVTYLLFQAVYTFSALVMVSLGFNDVASWRPLFGDFSSCTSLRGVWNEFWHQGMSTNLKNPAKYITSRLLRIPKSTIIWRYFYIMLVFQLSGLVHIVGDIAAGVPVSDSGVMQWFSIQALGMAIEDGAVALYKTISGSNGDEGKLWQKVLGFMWVCAWMVWTMPVWTYPISRESQGEGVLPFGLIQMFIQKK